MTSLYLLFWIVGAVLLQVVIYLAISFAGHWKQYRALRNVATELNIPIATEASMRGQPSLPAAWSGLRNFRVQRKVHEDVAGQVCSFYLAPEDAEPLPAFRPGQFLTFRLDIPSPQGGVESVVRCYSLSDAPHPNTYRISIKRAPAPLGSTHAPGRASNYFHDRVDVGSVLQVRAPSGHFHIDRSDAPVVLIGGGIGITPMLSIVNWCLSEQPAREIWMFYGVRQGAELVMPSHLQALAATHPNFHLHVCFSDPQDADLVGSSTSAVHYHQSRVNTKLMRSLLPLKLYHFYICGPTPMLAALVPALEDWGVPDARIHFEAFGPASIPRKKTATSVQAADTVHDQSAPVMVNFAKTGKQLLWQPGRGSLLDFAEANGIVVDSGCRAGSCGSCQTAIRAGEVAYTQTPDCNPEPGSCLLCVCIPKTAVTLEA